MGDSGDGWQPTEGEELPSRDLFQQLFHAVNDAVFVHDPDTGEILDVNETACEMYGFTRAQAREVDVADLSSGKPPYTMEAASEYMQRAVDGDPQVFDWHARDLDGELFWVEVNMRQATVGGRDVLLVTGRDITDRKEMEAELRRRENRFRSMFERHSAPMLLIEPETGDLRNANDAATDFYGYSREEMTSMTVQDLNQLSPEEVAQERERARREDRNHFVFEHELANGEVRTVEVHSSPIDLGDDDVLFSIIHDVTERAERDRQLQVIERMLRHNLRNDMNVVRGRAETIRMKGPPSVAAEAQQVIDTSDDVLAMAEKERTITTVLQKRPSTRRFDVGTVVREAVATARADHPGASVSVDCQDGVTAKAIPHIETAVKELVDNAIAHTETDAPTVSVTVTGGETVTIAVADDGPGIPEMERHILIGREDTTPLAHSRGLGLWLVSVIVDQSDGWLSFDEPDDGGSVVTIELQAS